MSSYTAITEDGKYLIHYGVKGMKWGKKKARRKSVSNPSYTNEQKSAIYNGGKGGSKVGGQRILNFYARSNNPDDPNYHAYWIKTDVKQKSKVSGNPTSVLTNRPSDKNKSVTVNKSSNTNETKKGTTKKNSSDNTTKKKVKKKKKPNLNSGRGSNSSHRRS